MTTQRREGGVSLWPEDILGMGPYYRDPDEGGRWRGIGGWVGDPDAMRAHARVVLACFDAGLCPCCGTRMCESSPGWVRCPTSYATGPRTDGSDPIEHRVTLSEETGRPAWRYRRCADPTAVPFDPDLVAAVAARINNGAALFSRTDAVSLLTPPAAHP